jgi:hypothetical protein
MTSLEEFVFMVLGLAIGTPCGILIGVQLAVNWTDPVKEQVAEQLRSYHTVGRPMDIP